jgi:antitoxin VapB
VASLFVTPKTVELWTNSIEQARFREEETRGLALTYRVHPWMSDEKADWLNKRMASDGGSYGTKNLGQEIAALRASLLPEEIVRYRKVGRLAGEAMVLAARKLRKGWAEFQLAATLSEALVERGLEASVVLVGSDERLRKFRHPIPTFKKIRKSAMMVVCARGYGLVANLTRIVHFGKVPVDLQRRHLACLAVETAMWEASKPGVAAAQVFRAAVREYSRQGFPGEWEKHHQGGPTGYDTRDFLAVPGETRRLVVNQALAWNPSITGTKSEDTVLMTAKGLEVLTPTPGWPMVKVEGPGGSFLRPGFLVR